MIIAFKNDDCPICQAMKKAEEEGKELSLEELKEAFQEAKKVKAAIVGNFPDEFDLESN